MDVASVSRTAATHLPRSYQTGVLNRGRVFSPPFRLQVEEARQNEHAQHERDSEREYNEPGPAEGKTCLRWGRGPPRPQASGRGIPVLQRGEDVKRDVDV